MFCYGKRVPIFPFRILICVKIFCYAENYEDFQGGWILLQATMLQIKNAYWSNKITSLWACLQLECLCKYCLYDVKQVKKKEKEVKKKYPFMVFS